jgi:osmotically inducible protein OsmC
MERQATVIWKDGLHDGSGEITTQSGALSRVEYSFNSRFAGKSEKAGTNPEELLASAHAACYSMALTGELERAGLKPRSIHTEARVTLAKNVDGYSIPEVSLHVTGDVPEATDEQFVTAAETAKKNCPVSKLFNAKIGLEAILKREEDQVEVA